MVGMATRPLCSSIHSYRDGIKYDWYDNVALVRGYIPPNRTMTITLSDSALTKLQTLYDPSKYRGLRVAVKGAGCSGMQYVLEWSIHKNLEDHESVYEGIPILSDAKSAVYVDGAMLDWQVKGLNEGFEFVNPKEKARCGCGESFLM
jgi:iron-sulfur cluster assembly protein